MTPTPDRTEGPPALVVDGAIATIRLRRPARRNSLSDEDLHVLLAELAQVQADASVRALVLRATTDGQPRPVFCAGYQVDGFDSSAHDPRLFEQVPAALERMRPVTICALGGSVYGGATDIVLACDLLVGLVGTEWRMPANALGLHYYPDGLRRYVSRLGPALAKTAFLTARALPVEQLDRAGLFAVLADAAGFETAVDNLAAAVAALAPRSTQDTKCSIDEIAAGRFDEARLREREATSLASADFAEGRAAFAALRRPSFSGA